MATAEYSIADMKHFMGMMEGMYDIVRLIDPIECKELEFDENHVIHSHPCYDVWNADHRCKDCSSYRACMTGSRLEKTELFRGTVFHIQSNPVHLVQPDGSRYDCVLELITSTKATDSDKKNLVEKERQEYAPALRLRDPLTGLYNREGFIKAVRDVLINGSKKPRLMVASDIIQFRLIQSLFGKEKCNEILLEISRIIRRHSSENAIFGRITEDRFGLCIAEDLFSPDKIENGVEEVRQLLSDSEFRFEVRTGIYRIKDADLSIPTMFDRAEMALDTIRENSRQHYAYFDDSMMENILYRQKVIGEFDAALEAGDYHIFLQPQVTRDGEIQGAEALARLIKKGKVIPPVRFIGILEDAGLIGRLDSYIWELAVNQLHQWKDTEYASLYLSVNISALDFYYIDVYETLTTLMDKYQVPREKLRLEITETALMTDPEKQLPLIQQLRDQGFLVEIDDFGKGYSSLSMLKDIEADALKIDMGFLADSENTHRGEKILRSIIDMSKELEMETITEGVETKDQLNGLVDKGCEMFQGYYFAKPMSVEDFESLYKTGILVEA